MPRPQKCRRVAFMPDVTYFKPAGVPMRMLDEILLSVEEAEAIRLKDLEGLEQTECAGRMNISRPTFQRVLTAARQKMADAILHGKAIRIEGGNFEMVWNRFRCFNGHVWDVPLETMTGSPPELCPTCSTADIAAVQPIGMSHGRKGPGGRHGAGHGRHQPDDYQRK